MKSALGSWLLARSGHVDKTASRLAVHRTKSQEPRAKSASAASPEPPPLTPTQLAWRQLRKNRFAMAGGAILLVLYGMALFADILAPYPTDLQRRELFYHPPTPLRWRSHASDQWRRGNPGSAGRRVSGVWLWRPHVAATRLEPGTAERTFVDDPRVLVPVRFFVLSYPYRFLGVIPMRLHLFGTSEQAPIFLLGTDELGRDVFSRLLRGSQISLSVGLIAIMITFSLGLVVGGISGYYGGAIDNLLMRFCEVMMSIPSFYLLLALAGVLPPTLPSGVTYILIIVILSFVGWAGLARVIRGIALSVREREYVEAARALGISDFKIVLRHVLPSTFSFAIVSATLAVPGYILGEAGLSFLGLGIREPMPSWGNMLTAAQKLEVLDRYHWILAPGFLIFITVMAFNFLGDGLRDALDPKLRR
jgi:peptide/nickel transport system permease protein